MFCLVTGNYFVSRRRLPCFGVVCSSSQLAPPIGLYAASLVSLTGVLIGWRASNCDAPTHIVMYPNKHGEYPPSPTWRASSTWRKQKAFPLPVEKAGNSLPFFRGRGQSYARRHGTWNSLVLTGCAAASSLAGGTSSEADALSQSRCFYRIL